MRSETKDYIVLDLLKIAAEVARPEMDRSRKGIIGAVGVRKDNVIVHARNGIIPFPSGRYPAIHAEARLCKKLGRGAVVYVARTRKDGSLALARPCINCIQIMTSYKVKAVFWTIDNDDWGGMEL
jgi:tRNA(Arg) A34 adenosine deaminase TadA